jgi:hypothetical protein
MKKRNRLGAGEFTNLYAALKARWDAEVAQGIHSQRGFHTNLAKTLGVDPSGVTNTVTAARKGGSPRFTARQWLALSNRFGYPVETLLRISSGQVLNVVSKAG